MITRRLSLSLSVIFCLCMISSVMVSATNTTKTTDNKKKIKSITWTDYDKNLTIEKGEKIKLGVTYSPTKKIDKKLKWKSSKKKVVSVTQKGVIKGKKNGTAVITAKTTDGSNKKIKLTVTVGKKVSELSFTNTDTINSLHIGETFTLNVAFTPSNASNKNLIWSSSDTDVATVDANGKITPVSNGAVVITAESTDGSDVEIDEQFDVVTLADSISLAQSESTPYHINTASHTLYARSGVELSLKATFSPATVSDTRLSFESSNDSVARVDNNGNVLTIKSGIAVITATTMDGSEKSAKFTLYVNSFDKSDCTFVAHRGYSELAPGNSLSAFKLAMKEGFEYVELDVWPTSDDKFAVCHDKSLKTIAGYDVNITDIPLSRAMNYRIITGNNVSTYSGEYIPSLDQVLALSSQYPEAKYYIELKQTFSEKQVTELLKLIRKYNLVDKVRIISFKDINLTRIRRIKDYDGDTIELGYLTYQLDQNSIEACVRLNAEVGVAYYQITKDIVKYAHEKGVRVNAWTVPNIYMAGFLIDTAKVDCITTNYKFFE